MNLGYRSDRRTDAPPPSPIPHCMFGANPASYSTYSATRDVSGQPATRQGRGHAFNGNVRITDGDEDGVYEARSVQMRLRPFPRHRVVERCVQRHLRATDTATGTAIDVYLEHAHSTPCHVRPGLETSRMAGRRLSFTRIYARFGGVVLAVLALLRLQSKQLRSRVP